jgi:hypothetical protein
MTKSRNLGTGTGMPMNLKKLPRINCAKHLVMILSSVGEPDPDSHVFGPSGSGSISQRY